MRVRRVRRQRVYRRLNDLVIAVGLLAYQGGTSGSDVRTADLELVPQLRLALPWSFATT